MTKTQTTLERYVQKQSAPTLTGRPFDVGDELPLESIRTNGGTQARDGLNAATVQEYTEAMQSGKDFPLIMVYHDGTDHWLADGFHRLEAARQAGRATIRAEVRMGDKRAAILHAVGANATHGLRRTNADKRRAVELMLRDDEWKQWSDHKIAETCGVSQPFVGNIRRELVSDNGYQIPATRTVERNGTTYQMTPAAPQPIISEVVPVPDLADILLRLDAHGYAKTSTRTKGMTTFYSFRDFGGRHDEELSGEIELAEGELPLWLQELDSKASYAQAKQERYLTAKARAEALGYSLKREGLYFALYRDGMFLTQATLDQMEKTIAGHERDAARKRVAAAPAETHVDSVTIAAIRRQAEELGMQVAWEDDQVILYWQVDDIDGLAPMSYAAALDWLTTAYMEREKGGAQQPTIAAPTAPARLMCPTCGEPILNGIWGDLKECGECYHKRQRVPAAAALADLHAAGLPPDLHKAGYYWHSATPPTIALNNSARRWDAPTVEAAIESARTHKDAKGEPLTVFPALTPLECKALLREAKLFIASGLEKKLPTIGQALRIAAHMALEVTED